MKQKVGVMLVYLTAVYDTHGLVQGTNIKDAMNDPQFELGPIHSGNSF